MPSAKGNGMSVIQWSPAAWGGQRARPAGLPHAFTVAMPPAPLVNRPAAEPASPPRTRTRLWELAAWMHCSIVGTCLTTAELRHVLVKLGLVQPDISDHDAHKTGVTIAARHDAAGKLLHKALDARHRLTLNSFAKATTAADVRALWQSAMESGEIPGAYWAVMTHPASDRALLGAAFGDVHMLSHLVGAANRADIRRLRALEADRATLEDKLARQQEQLRTAVVSRDATIQDLRATLAARLAAEPAPATDRTLRDMLADLEARLGRETARRQSAEQKLAALRAELQAERARHAAAAQQAAAARADLDALERQFAPDTPDAAQPLPRLDGRAILYVGGRPQVLANLRGLAARAGATLLEHDGGVEDSDVLLAGLIARADVVMFPVDCVSHRAVGVVKRGCAQAGRPYIALRAASASAFLAALARLAPADAAAAPLAAAD